MGNFRIGHGYDIHSLKEGLPLFLGGIKIDSHFGCVAHSDGDVAIHALCDALLGALALGDIGLHFPDKAEIYRGIDSKKLLAKVMEMVWSNGYAITNVDISIALQAPKLRPYIDSMRGVLAQVMHCHKECVSIKATTAEKLGFVGRGEGCEVWAVCLLEQNITP